METKTALAVDVCREDDQILALIVTSQQTQSLNDAISIERVAKSIASSGFLANLWNAFEPGYVRGQWCFDLWLIAGKSAEFILEMFSNKAKNTKEACVVSVENST